jgi:hypothetical protein
MTGNPCRAAVGPLLALGWQAAAFGASLRLTKDKLERPCRIFRRNRRAAAAVKLAIVAPVFFLMVFGMIEYEQMVTIHDLPTNAARDGARLADLDGAALDGYLTSDSVGGATVEVIPNPLSRAEFGEPVTVAGSLGFDQVSRLLSPMYVGGKSMFASTLVRREAVQ